MSFLSKNLQFIGIDLCNEREQIFKSVYFTKSLENSRCTKREKDTSYMLLV